MARDFITPLTYRHRCALCEILMPKGTPPLCETCAARPDGQALQSKSGKKVRHTGPKRVYQWTSERDEILRQHYDSTPEGCRRVYALIPDFPRPVIRRRAGMLRLTRVKEKNWTPRELRTLKKWVGRRSERWIAKKLHRSENAVHVKIIRLKLLAEARKRVFCATSIAEGLGIEARAVVHWIKQGWLTAEQRGTLRTPQQGGDLYVISIEDLRAFLIGRQDAWYLRRCEKRFLVRVLTACDCALDRPKT